MDITDAETWLQIYVLSAVSTATVSLLVMLSLRLPFIATVLLSPCSWVVSGFYTVFSLLSYKQVNCSLAHVSTSSLLCVTGEAGSASEPALVDKKGSSPVELYACERPFWFIFCLTLNYLYRARSWVWNRFGLSVIAFTKQRRCIKVV